MKLLPVVIAFSFILTGCSTTINKSQQTGAVDVNVKSHLTANIDVDMTKMVKGSAHHTRLLWIFPIKSANRYADGVTYSGGAEPSFFSGGMVDETKSAAAYKAVVPNKVDVLVAPQYIIQVKSYFLGAWKEVTASVTGYAGKIRDIKTNPKK